MDDKDDEFAHDSLASNTRDKKERETETDAAHRLKKSSTDWNECTDSPEFSTEERVQICIAGIVVRWDFCCGEGIAQSSLL